MIVREPKPARISDVVHLKVAYSKDLYHGHPRHGGMFNFGGGEIAVTFNRAPCSYSSQDEVGHEFGYLERSEQVLARSFDRGKTWPVAEQTVIFRRGMDVQELRDRVWPNTYKRVEYDMSSPDSCFFFARARFGRDPGYGSARQAGLMRQGGFSAIPAQLVIVYRSPDRGRTWEDVGSVIAPPPHADSVLVNAHPPVRLADSTFALVATVGGGSAIESFKEAALYSSDDHGLSWEYMGPVARDANGIWGYTYSALILLPTGRLQCYAMRQVHNSATANWTFMAHSDDGGISWSEMRPIAALGHSPWVAARKRGDYSRPREVRDQAGRVVPTFEPLPTGHAIQRAPYPLLLRDGRIVVIYGRRKPPYGIGGFVSEDRGETWGREFILRSDAPSGDIGYPVSTEIEDGRVLTIYYYTADDGNAFGGTRYIAATAFSV